jgi:hypothetical protein
MDIAWHLKFAEVISCSRCTKQTDPNLLHDKDDLPQPGYIGSHYAMKRVLLVGQNPGTRKKAREEMDKRQSSALEQLRDNPTIERYRALECILKEFLPLIPLQQKYFPLEECGLKLEEISYCNLIRCRTEEDRRPRRQLAKNCIEEHFTHWLTLLQPAVVIFLGKWAYDRGKVTVEKQNIPCDFINRQRSLSAQKRKENLNKIAELVSCALAQ